MKDSTYLTPDRAHRVGADSVGGLCEEWDSGFVPPWCLHPLGETGLGDPHLVKNALYPVKILRLSTEHLRPSDGRPVSAKRVKGPNRSLDDDCPDGDLD